MLTSWQPDVVPPYQMEASSSDQPTLHWEQIEKIYDQSWIIKKCAGVDFVRSETKLLTNHKLPRGTFCHVITRNRYDTVALRDAALGSL